MSTRWYKSVLLGAAGLCLVLVVVDPNIVVRKPFGPKMCEHLCNRIAGCSEFTFVLSDFICHITNVTSYQLDLDNGIIVHRATEDEEKIYAETAMKCSQDENIFYTRQHSIKCRPSSLRLPVYMQEDTRPDELKRLLMLPFSSEFMDLQGRQLFLHNNSVAPYPYILTVTSAVAFIPSLRKVIVATRRPDLIFLVSVGNQTKNIIKNKMLITGIAADDGKQTVFMTTRYPQASVSVMTTEGKSFRSLVTLQCRKAGAIAADEKRSLLYVSDLCQYKVLTYTYQGVQKRDAGGVQKILNSLSIDVFKVCMDVEADILYLIRQDRKQIFKMSLSDYSLISLTTLPEKVYSIFAHNNKVYVSMYDTDYVLAINVHDLNATAKLTIDLRRVSGVQMCIIT